MTDREMIITWIKTLNEKKEILLGFDMIHKSLDFTQAQIDAKFLELDKALRYHKDVEVQRIKAQILDLITKVGREDEYAKLLLDKYALLCQDEKKELLPNSGQKK